MLMSLYEPPGNYFLQTPFQLIEFSAIRFIPSGLSFREQAQRTYTRFYFCMVLY